VRSLERLGTTLRVGPFASLGVTGKEYEGEVAEEYAGAEFLALLAEPEKLTAAPGAEVLLDGRNRVVAVKIGSPAGGTIDAVVKEFRLQGINKLKSAFLRSKAAKAWRGALALAGTGFNTPRPIAYLEKRSGRFIERSFFIAERIYGCREIRDDFREAKAETLRPLLSGLARTLFGLHEEGILHRDLSDGNILVKEESGKFHFLFLHTNRVRAKRRLSPGRRAKNLVRLGVPPAHRRYFLEQYAAAGDRPLREMFVFWYKLSKGGFAGWQKVKKALRLKKLARRMKIQ